MTNLNKNMCRVCLTDGAEHPIFDSIESKESIYSKLCLCFKEKIEDIEGYPRKICNLCIEILHTVCNFITKYQASCKFLENSHIVIKKEVGSDSDSDFLKQEIALTVCKNEPDSNWLESLDDSLLDEPLSLDKKLGTKITTKLKNVKKINFKRKSVLKSKTKRKTSKTASSILEAEFEWNGEVWCFKSSKLQDLKEEPKEKQTDNKLVLPKLPKVPKPHPAKLCDICGAIFKNKGYLAKHKQIKHFGKPMKCPKCPRILVSEFNLKRHIRRVHEDKKFVCDSCGIGFAFQGLLNNHKKVVHLRILKPKIKNHLCDICNKRFNNSKSLIIHERSAHTGIRPAKCTECSASFYHEEYLKEHMRLHTGETPFKCPICGRGYAQRGNMKSHMSHNHQLADLSPEIIRKLKPSWLRYLKKP